MAKFQVFGIAEESIVDGKGIRYAIFTQGCPHQCPGCHNPESQPFTGGVEMDTDQVFRQILENPLLKGVTFSGGEPFCQPEPLAELGEKIHGYPGRKLDITVFTGYTWEELQGLDTPGVQALLDQTDVLIDGRFDLSQRDLRLRFRGSRNQRVIDVPRTRQAGYLVLLGEEDGY